jgi:hypothetical protein
VSNRAAMLESRCLGWALSAPKGLDVHGEAGDGVCEGSIQSIIRPPLKKRFKSVLPAVEGLRATKRGRAGQSDNSRYASDASHGSSLLDKGLVTARWQMAAALDMPFEVRGVQHNSLQV